MHTGSPERHLYPVKGKKNVIIHDTKWENTKNKTTGSLIEFVSIHKKYSYIEAVAHITGNKRIALLEKNVEEKNFAYKSFYIPKEKKMPKEQAAKHLGYFLKQLGFSSGEAQSLLSKKQAQVSKNGSIRLFAKDDDKGAFEYQKDENETWKKSKQGQFKSPFYSRLTKSSHAVIFTDPFKYLEEKQKGNVSKIGDSGLLVLMEPNANILSKYLVENPQITSLSFVVDRSGKSKNPLNISFEGFKSKLKHYDIECNNISGERGYQRDHFSLDINF